MSIPKQLRRVSGYLWREWVRPLAVMAAIVLPFKSAIADYNWVPSGSMKPTILEGDVVIVNKLAYDLKVPFTLQRLAAWNNPVKDDIVVFFSPKDGMRLVKRVIGVPGDQIELRDEVLSVNGRKLDYTVGPGHPFRREIYEDPEPVVAREAGGGHDHWVMVLPSRSARRSFAPLVVPAGKYFMMGDSRDNSLDSRYFGLVDRELIVGRASRVLVSLDKNHHYVPRLRRSLSLLDQ
jgi:signal peptidase I